MIKATSNAANQETDMLTVYGHKMNEQTNGKT